MQPDDTIKSAKQFATWASDLQDTESVDVMKVVYLIQMKYSRMRNTPRNLEAMRDELLHKLADVGLIAQVDVSPCFYGDPPVCEIVGKVDSDPVHKYGFDHEKKEYEVKKATARGEDFLGQKESANKRRDKKRKKK